MADERTPEQQEALDKLVAHPGLPKPGTMTSRDGQPYNPTDVPNDTSGNVFLNSFPAPEASPDQPGPPVPPAPVEGEKPAVETAPPVAVETPPAAQEPQPLIFGKYRTMEDAEKGWQKREELLRDRNAENIAMKAATSVMENAGFRKEREKPTPPANIPVQFDAQGQPFIPAGVIEERAEKRAAEIAEQRVQETLQPIANMNNITNRMQQEFTDFGNDNAEFSAYLAENPELAKRVTADPEFALPATYLMFRELRGQQTATTAVQTTKQSQAVVDTARAQVAATAPVAQSSRSIQESESRDKRVQGLYDHGVQTGDMRPFSKERIKEALNVDGTLDAIAKAGWGR